MVAISFAAAAFALTSMVMAIPTAPSPSVTGTPGDAPSTLFISEADARELAKARYESESLETRDVTDLDARQIPSFGRFCEHWDWAGQCYYQRFEIDNLGHYIGDAWNDRISSVEGYDNDKKCTYYTHWSSDFGGYCHGTYLIVSGRVAYARLADNLNDQISCYQCSWR